MLTCLEVRYIKYNNKNSQRQPRAKVFQHLAIFLSFLLRYDFLHHEVALRLALHHLGECTEQ